MASGLATRERSGAGPSAAGPGRRYSLERRQRRTAYLFLLPALGFFGLLFFYPLGQELITSLYTGPRADRFSGLQNYAGSFLDPAVRNSFWLTLIYAAGVLVLTIGLGLLLALILNQPLRGRTVLRAVLLVPYLTSIVITGLLWRNILDPQVGILNRLFEAVGLPAQNWLLTDPLATLIGISVWQHTGYTSVLFLAGLQGIPEVYYEAARIDGASVLQRFRYVTIPFLAPATLFVSVIGVIWSLQQFALPFLVTDGGPGNATDLYIFHVYNVAFEFRDFGYASALSYLLLVVIMIFTLIQFRAGRRSEFA
ncbi:MAG: ABC transporter permease subunit [Streptosporangiales bacterium]|nr:ABC transporter permease subunit [Streptosporangiales bacterium]